MRKLLAAALLLSPLPLFAWSAPGHRITAQLAFDRLSPHAQAEITTLLAKRGKKCGDPAKGCSVETSVTLADAAPLPDDFRNQEGGEVGREWHFVDIERKNLAFVADRDCEFDDCIVGRIQRLKAMLADKHAPPEQRADALIYLTHFVGDIHQPFHCITETKDGVSDNGGNSVKVTFAPDVDVPQFPDEKPNLHSVWDRSIAASRRLSVDENVARLKELLATRDAAKLMGSMKVSDWANESHTIARKEYVANGATLDNAYFSKGREIVDEQLMKGALRLQKLLEDALR